LSFRWLRWLCRRLLAVPALNRKQHFALSLTALIALVAVFAAIVVGAIVVIESRDGRNLTDREIAFMAARLAVTRPAGTFIKISCAFDDPRSCEYARGWGAVFDKAGWTRYAITPIQWYYAGVTINVKDPSVAGYYDLISSFDALRIKPQANIVSDTPPNVIQIIIGK
jgi:hypothetical protein